jgi:hypothetical protein
MNIKRDKSPVWLLDYKFDVYSQQGEDGIVQKILEILVKNDMWCVEFGAWDGVHLSNTRNLILNKGYSAVLIEGSKNRFLQLQKNYVKNERVITINRFVGMKEGDNLAQILKVTPIPQNFDFLSIDIDGNDYHVWKAMSNYRPKVICVEFNQTIPSEVRFVQTANPQITQGSSLLSLVELGKDKGYELVSVLSCNAFFVRSEYYSLFDIIDNSPTILRTDLSYITSLLSKIIGFLGFG